MHSPFSHMGSLFLKRRPVQLTFFVTRRCNFRCPFCFYVRDTNSQQRDQELSLDEIERVAGSLGPLLWVLFSGGEVFLREDLAGISAIFHDVNRAAILTYPTNGWLPEVIVEKVEKILVRCEKSVVVIKLSLDGVGEKHDLLRRMPGSFEKVMATHERLGALRDAYPNLEVGINTLFCSENQNSVDGREGVIEFVHGLDKIDSHTVSMVRGHLDEERYKDIDLAEYGRMIRSLESRTRSGNSRFHRFRGGRFKAAQDTLQRRLIHRTMLQGRRLVPCYAGRLNLVLTETGELYPCELSTETLGNVRDAGYDVKKMLRSKQAQEVLDGISRGKCFCSHECNFMTNILFNPRMYPALFHDYILSSFMPWAGRHAAMVSRAQEAGG